MDRADSEVCVDGRADCSDDAESTDALGNNHLKAAQLLLDFSFDDTLPNRDGLTPFQLSCCGGILRLSTFFSVIARPFCSSMAGNNGGIKLLQKPPVFVMILTVKTYKFFWASAPSRVSSEKLHGLF